MYHPASSRLVFTWECQRRVAGQNKQVLTNLLEHSEPFFSFRICDLEWRRNLQLWQQLVTTQADKHRNTVLRTCSTRSKLGPSCAWSFLCCQRWSQTRRKDRFASDRALLGPYCS